MSVIREGEDLILQLRYTERVGAFDLGLSAAQKGLFFAWLGAFVSLIKAACVAVM